MESTNKNQSATQTRGARRTASQAIRSALADQRTLTSPATKSDAATSNTTANSTTDQLQRIADTAAGRDARLREIARTVAANVTNPQYYFDLAQELCRQHKYDRAMRLFERALAVDPKHVASCLALARCHQRRNQTEAAERYLQQAHEIEPDNKDILLFWATMLISQGRTETAEAKLRRVLEAQPGHPVALYQLAQLERQHGRLESALKMMDQALSTEDCDGKSRFGRGMLALQQGEWSYGWKEFELQSRAGALQQPGQIPFPVWNGETLRGKRLLIMGSSSVVDDLMFASCLHDVSVDAEKCVLAVDEVMRSLFERSFDRVESVHPRQVVKFQPDEFDVWAPLSSLPRFLRTTTARFPAESAPLVPNASWRQWHQENLFNLGPGLKIGVSWEGLWPSSRRDARATRLADWKPILDVEGVHLINLQGPDSAIAWADALELHPRAELTHWDHVEPRGDVDDFASLVAALDLVISVPNRVAHLAGALGVPVWNILADWPSWRWGLTGQKTPWYPTMTLYRAAQPNNWLAPMTAMAGELKQLAHKKANWNRA